MKKELVRKGDLMAFVDYVRVDQVLNGGNDLKVYDLDSKFDFKVLGKDLVEKSFSADRYEDEKKVTKTEAAELLIKAYNRPFTVGFTKSDGSSRTLRGRLLSPEPLLGRSHVEDLDITSGSRLRLVDHRKIEFLIVDGIKYVAK
ncbi:MAG: hypothetical protein AABW56_02235 [Nanoarchaeota archaeon]